MPPANRRSRRRAPVRPPGAPPRGTAGGGAFTLTATGTNFVSGSLLRWNGSARTTSFVSSTQLTATVTAADLAAAGTASVTVFSPTPGGGTSGALAFTVNNPAPTLGSLAPSHAAAGGAGLPLTPTRKHPPAGSPAHGDGRAR